MIEILFNNGVHVTVKSSASKFSTDAFMQVMHSAAAATHSIYSVEELDRIINNLNDARSHLVEYEDQKIREAERMKRKRLAALEVEIEKLKKELGSLV